MQPILSLEERVADLKTGIAKAREVYVQSVAKLIESLQFTIECESQRKGYDYLEAKFSFRFEGETAQPVVTYYKRREPNLPNPYTYVHEVTKFIREKLGSSDNILRNIFLEAVLKKPLFVCIKCNTLIPNNLTLTEPGYEGIKCGDRIFRCTICIHCDPNTKQILERLSKEESVTVVVSMPKMSVAPEPNKRKAEESAPQPPPPLKNKPPCKEVSAATP